ncbi:hypothetical protein GCM10010425_73990 [Streptomyces spororaveus]
MGLRLFRRGYRSAHMGDPKGRRFALIAPVWGLISGVMLALTRFHDGIVEVSAASPPQRLSSAPNRPPVAVSEKRIAI